MSHQLDKSNRTKSIDNTRSHVRSPPNLYLSPIKSPSFENTPTSTFHSQYNNSELSVDHRHQEIECDGRAQSQASCSSRRSGSATSTGCHGVHNVVELIKSLRLKIIAFDFDYTIVTIHTGGQWIDSASKLAEFVRPCFRDLIPALLKSDINVCIVTYSPQERLIREVLKIAMKNEHENIEELLSKVIIRGNSKLLLEQYGAEACYSNGKQIHLSTCKALFEGRKHQDNKAADNQNSGASSSSRSGSVNGSSCTINNSDILLIDDDEQNLRLAVENGHLAFPVGPHTRLVDLYDYLSKCRTTTNKTL